MMMTLTKVEAVEMVSPWCSKDRAKCLMDQMQSMREVQVNSKIYGLSN